MEFREITNEEIEVQIKDVLKTEEKISYDTNLLELGLSSIQIMQLTNQWRKKGYQCTFANLISNPYIQSWTRLLVPNKTQTIIRTKEDVNMYQPFSLTDVQYAYWIGRKGGQYLGQVGCHGYLEIDGENVDGDRLSRAWDKLQQYHPMLRVQFTKDGMQQIMNKPYKNGITIHDYRGKDARNHLEQLRNQLSHRLLKIEEGQVAELQLTLLDHGKTRIHFDIDLLIADVKSYQILLRDLAILYVREEALAAPPEWNFATYLKKDKKNKEEKVIKAKEYWDERQKTLPGKPEMPIRNVESEINYPQFTRRKKVLPSEKWERFKRIAAKYQVTPAMALLTIYGKVIERWSENDHFLINIPLFNRDSNEKDIEEVVADFTTILLLEMNLQEQTNFVKTIERIQAQFHKDAEYVDYSGVSVQRDYLKLHPEQSLVAPIVFSCNLGIPLINEEFMEAFGQMGYMISQTPQVWLDFQVFDIPEGLLMIWDGIDEIFPDHLLDSMFQTYISVLEELAKSEENWEKEVVIHLEDQIVKRKQYEVLDANIKSKGIHMGFFEQAEKNPNQIALIDTSEEASYTYGKVSRQALAIAMHLRTIGVKEGDCVGIAMERGHKQVEAILGVLAAGAAYVAMGISLPLNRKEIICSKASVKVLITDQKEEIKGLFGVKVLAVEEVNQESFLEKPVPIKESASAYIIFTSGSTGEPKGVEITHSSAFNTIYDINQKYGVNEKDRAFAISATDFDLSVYDMFGLLSAGGSLVLISEDERRNAAIWAKLVEKYDVTIWNSVPVLLDMLLLELAQKEISLNKLRLALLSGDWIGLDLPKRLKTIAENARFISLGGATEGSIWSNYYEVILPLPANFSSIPYGMPLVNQKYRVVNTKNEDCPDWVPGELLIGGAGVAKGYIGDPEITKRQFIELAGEIWYKTGDNGRFWPNGIIEFLGRRDQQVKIRGHRIEIEEIEKTYKNHPDIQNAVVLPLGEERTRRYLASFVVSKTEVKASEKKAEMKEALDETVMDYCNNHDLTSEEKQGYAAFEEQAERLAIQQIGSILESIGLEIDHTDQIYKKLNEIEIQTCYQPLVIQWIELLKREKSREKSLDDNDKILKELKEKTEIANRFIPMLDQLINPFVKRAREILRGEINALEVMYTDENQSIDSFSDKMPGADFKNELILKLLEQMIYSKAAKKTNIRILELGARKLDLTKALMSRLEEINFTYICTDKSSYFKHKAEDVFKADKRVQYKSFDLYDEEPELTFSEGNFDVIVSFDGLHRVKNIEKVFRLLNSKLAEDGILIFSEKTKNSSLQLISAAFLEMGFHHFKDKRKDTKLPLLDVREWSQYLRETGFANVTSYPSKGASIEIYNQAILIGYSDCTRKQLEKEELDSYLKQYLPSYMIPSVTVFLEDIPVTENGKVNRRRLALIGQETKIEKIRTKPEAKLDIEIAAIWKKVLRADNIFMEDDFYLLGGDSLVATQLSIEMKKSMNLELSLEVIFMHPVFGEFVQRVKVLQNKELIEKDYLEELPAVTFQRDQLYDTFPLTDIQQSYWIGRSGAYELGEFGVHCYFEMDCEPLELEKLERAFNVLIKRHDMMRAIILEDGKNQRILETTEEYKIKTYHFSNKEDVKEGNALLEIRKEMAAKVFDTSKWPMFDIRVSTVDKQYSRLHLSFDNIIFDGFSIFRLFSEWRQIYFEGSQKLKPIVGSFRDYVLTLEKTKDTAQYQRDLSYWKERVISLPPAPQLPQSDEKGEQKFTRFETILAASEWDILQRNAEKYHLTNTVVFLAAYAEVMGRFSKSLHFTINLTRFSKLPLYEGVEDLIGDFTSLTLLEIDNRKGMSFLERCKNIQKQLLQDLEHSLVSGVVVEREFMKRQSQNQISMPIVFTSGFGVNSKQNHSKDYLGDIVYGESQTPQIWLDHQVSEQNGRLFLSWDAVCGLFPKGLVEEMFEAYKELVEQLKEEKNWEEKCSSLLTCKTIEVFEQENCKVRELTKDTLIGLFEESVKSYGDRIAISSNEISLTYKELYNRVELLAKVLIQNRLGKNTLVGVLMEKGYEQIIAILAILKAGGAYLPIDAKNPKERIDTILKKGQVSFVITQTKLYQEMTEYFKDLIVIDANGTSELFKEAVEFPKIQNTDLAYVIFTSGSTGEPKGVMIDHKGAVNTILDVNQRFSVTKEDATLFLSNLNFDLSVYDIFGMLCIGGKIVVPENDKVKDPAHWIELIKEFGVTVWNSVPTFMQMMIEFNSEKKKEITKTLKLVLLSGDWIPITLPERMKEQFYNVKIIGLGGATEASIWSNYFEIPEIVPEKWKSIPYGKPLTNQKYYILNETMDKCPPWVTGQLYIAGAGVAKGYYGDEKKTKESFLIYQKTGEIIYKTGDFGRYWSDGEIEFLGREDNQIKLNGHRIELGEIEAQIKKIDGIQDSIVTLSKSDTPCLAGHIVLEKEEKNPLQKTIQAERVFDQEQFSNQLQQNLSAITSDLDRKELEAYQKGTQLLSIKMICSDFSRLGVFNNTQEQVTLKEIIELGHIVKDYEQLISHFVRELLNHELLKEFSTSYYAEQNMQMSMNLCEKELSQLSFGSLGFLFEELERRLVENQEIRIELLQGKREAKELLIENLAGFLTPRELVKYDVTKTFVYQYVHQTLKAFVESCKEADFKVLEIASRAENNTNSYIGLLKPAGEYIFVDEASYLLEEKKKELAQSPVTFKVLNMKEPMLGEEIELHSINLIIADNTLHRFDNLDVVLENIKALLAPSGCLIFVESIFNSALMLETVAFFENGYGYLSDMRKESHLPLLSRKAWEELIQQHGFQSYQEEMEREVSDALGKTLIFAQNSQQLRIFDLEALKYEVKQKVPEYMVPSAFITYDSFPLTENGKVDRNKMTGITVKIKDAEKKKIIPPGNAREKQVAQAWQKIMQVEQVSVTDSFFEQGGDSLKAILFINLLKELFGYEITLQELFEHPTIAQLAELLLVKTEKISEEVEEMEQGSL